MKYCRNRCAEKLNTDMSIHSGKYFGVVCGQENELKHVQTHNECHFMQWKSETATIQVFKAF